LIVSQIHSVTLPDLETQRTLNNWSQYNPSRWIMINWVPDGIKIDNLRMGLFESLMFEGFEFNTQLDLDFDRMKILETTK
jgi:hypothetical protein